MRIKNLQYRAAEIAESGHDVAPGEVVEVDDDLGARLIEQTDNWQVVTTRRNPKDVN